MKVKNASAVNVNAVVMKAKNVIAQKMKTANANAVKNANVQSIIPKPAHAIKNNYSIILNKKPLLTGRGFYNLSICLSGLPEANKAPSFFAHSNKDGLSFIISKQVIHSI